MVVLAGLINLLTWPFASLAPGVGLDASWQVALHLAASEHLDFGRDIGFTYGPLGFLVVPLLVSGGTSTLAFVSVGVIRFLLILAMVVGARRAFGNLVLAAGVAYLVAAMLWEVTEFAGLLALLASLLLIQQPMTGKRAGMMAWWLGAAAACLLLVKLNVGIIACVGLFTAAWFQPPGRWRALARAASGFAIAFVGLWLVSGNRVIDIPRWAAWSWSITSGYSGGTMAEDLLVDRSWEYPAYLAFAAVLVGLCVWALRDGPRARMVGSVGVLVFGLWTGFKHGFIRHDPHVIFSFVSLAALPTAIVWKRDVLRVAGIAMAGVGAALAFQSWGIDPVATLKPNGRMGHAVDQARVVFDGDQRQRTLASYRQAVRDQLAVDPAIIAAIGTEGVHIAPHETSAVWAYGLTWRPIPHFQSFSTWTSQIDEANRVFLLGPRAPRFVLRQDIARYDLHSPVWESPGENLALLCRYSQRMTVGKWELLERGADRCGPARRIRVAVARAHVPIDVPDAGPEQIVYARVRWTPGIWERIRSAAFKPSRLPQVRIPQLNAISPFRVPAALLDAPLVLRAPVDIAAPHRVKRLLQADRLLFDFPNRAEVEFFAVAYRR